MTNHWRIPIPPIDIPNNGRYHRLTGTCDPNGNWRWYLNGKPATPKPPTTPTE